MKTRLRRPIDWNEVKRKAAEGATGSEMAARFHMSKQWFYHRKSTHRDPEVRGLFTYQRKPADEQTTR